MARIYAPQCFVTGGVSVAFSDDDVAHHYGSCAGRNYACYGQVLGDATAWRHVHDGNDLDHSGVAFHEALRTSCRIYAWSNDRNHSRADFCLRDLSGKFLAVHFGRCILGHTHGILAVLPVCCRRYSKRHLSQPRDFIRIGGRRRLSDPWSRARHIQSGITRSGAFCGATSWSWRSYA